MKKQKLNRKLTLRRETLRELTAAQLGKAAGGIPGPTRRIECISLPKGQCF
jgi:hypothetical protein